MKNQSIRDLVYHHRLTYKRIAEQIGISPEWLSRLLAKELSEGNRVRIETAIDELIAERVGSNGETG